MLGACNEVRLLLDCLPRKTGSVSGGGVERLANGVLGRGGVSLAGDISIAVVAGEVACAL